MVVVQNKKKTLPVYFITQDGYVEYSIRVIVDGCIDAITNLRFIILEYFIRNNNYLTYEKN